MCNGAKFGAQETKKEAAHDESPYCLQNDVERGRKLWYNKIKFIVAEYALKDMSKPIGVSEYKVTSDLPENLSKQLPSIEDIQKHIANEQE